jgi:diguanylate cyclase (GGDEF)-like protein
LRLPDRFAPTETAEKIDLGNGLYIALLNPAIALVLAAAFFTLWLVQPKQARLIGHRDNPNAGSTPLSDTLAILATAYAASAVGFVLQYFALPLAGLEASRFLSCLYFTVAVLCLAIAILKRYGRHVPYLSFGVLAGGGIVAMSWFLFVQPSLTWRIYAINFAFGGIVLLVAAELRKVRSEGPIQMAMFVLSLLSACNFFLRTLVAVRLHGEFTSYESFFSSTYWTTAQLSHATLSLLIALCLFAALSLEMMGVLKLESHTDPLSQLLNRRGFEERAAQLLDRCSNAKLPAALVLADLDHFKAVNDVHGHAAGDRVIMDFADKLRTAAGSRGVAGRIGGEEFAVLLPLTDLGAARLFAEAVRTLFSTDRVEGLAGSRLTASFGVAARSGEEGLAPLLRRADEALYQAKQSGRDSVRLSYQRPECPIHVQAAGPA